MSRRAGGYRANYRRNSLGVNRVQGLGQRGTISREGIVPNGRIPEFIDHLDEIAFRSPRPSRLLLDPLRLLFLAEIDAKAWTAFASETGLGTPLIRRRVAELADSVRGSAQAVVQSLSRPDLDAAAFASIAGSIRERAERCALTVKT